MKMPKTSYEKFERDIGQEILDAVLEIQSGYGKRFMVKITPGIEVHIKSGLVQTDSEKLLEMSKRP